MTVLDKMKSFFKRPKPGTKAEQSNPATESTEKKATEAPERKAGEASE